MRAPQEPVNIGSFEDSVLPVQLARPEWSSRFCQAPDESRQTRRTLIERLAETDTIILAAHFPAPTAGRIVCAREAFRIHT